MAKTREDICFFVGMGGEIHAVRRASGNGLAEALAALLGFPEKGRMIIPGKKLYLHGASDADWGGEEVSMRSTTGAYLPSSW